ncbi:MAG: hypothetical protein ACTSO9_03570 [Candidatus Helarchaeota archaeon]
MFPKYNVKTLILSLSVVTLTGITFPILSYPINYSIFISILLSLAQNFAFWGLILLFVNLVLHFDRKRREYKWKEFGMACGISFIPLLIYNILIPVISNQKAQNLVFAWDINLIRVSTSTDSFQILFFLSKLITVLCVFFFFLILSFAIRDTFNLELIKAIYLCVFIVILTYLLSVWIFTGWEIFEI